MNDGDGIDELRRQRKRERNSRDYQRAKSTRDHVLLRLDKGAAERLNAASAAAGLSRAAFARFFLTPLVDALGPRFPAIDRARTERGQSLPKFLAKAIDDALKETRSKSSNFAPPPAAYEFDQLFAPPSSEEA